MNKLLLLSILTLSFSAAQAVVVPMKVTKLSCKESHEEERDDANFGCCTKKKKKS